VTSSVGKAHSRAATSHAGGIRVARVAYPQKSINSEGAHFNRLKEACKRDRLEHSERGRGRTERGRTSVAARAWPHERGRTSVACRAWMGGGDSLIYLAREAQRLRSGGLGSARLGGAAR